MPGTLGSLDLANTPINRNTDFLSGRPTDSVLAELRGSNAVIVSEPFTYKHHVRTGDPIELALGESRARFRIADVYYDYGSARVLILIDPRPLLQYPSYPRPSNL